MGTSRSDYTRVVESVSFYRMVLIKLGHRVKVMMRGDGFHGFILWVMVLG